MKKIVLFLLIVVLGFVGYYLYQNKTPQSGEKIISVGSDSKDPNKIKLTYAVHWQQKSQIEGIFEGDTLKTKGLKHYLAEYSKLNPNIEFDIQSTPYNDYAGRLTVLSKAGLAPDIYQIYSPWGVGYVKDGLLDTPPASVIEDVKKNYVSSTGVTIDGKIWGIPTEINNFALLYNKELFAKAGLVDSKGNIDYPKNWTDLVAKASKLTKRDSKGVITQYGIVFSKGDDWQVVDPFLSLLFSNGGKYLSEDNKKSLFNSPAGVAALEGQVSLFKNGSTDAVGKFFDFSKGNVAMVISPPWTKSGFQKDFGDKFESTVGVTSFPFFSKNAVLQYTWFVGVMAGSNHKQEAWDFLTWFTSDIQDSGTTRYGDFLADNIAAIPSRKVDFAAHKSVLGDFFTKTYVDQMKYGVQEPNVAEASKIKSILMSEIESAWAGKKSAKEALDAAALSIDKIL